MSEINLCKKNFRHHSLCGGEKVLETMQLVEDTKGNPGMRGRLLCTNLRIIWYSIQNYNFNICE